MGKYFKTVIGKVSGGDYILADRFSISNMNQP